MTQRQTIPTWFILAAAIALFTNGLAVFTSVQTATLMGGVSEFARTVRAHDRVLAFYFNWVAFPVPTAIVIAYLRPIIIHLRCTAPAKIRVRSHEGRRRHRMILK